MMDCEVRGMIQLVIKDAPCFPSAMDNADSTSVKTLSSVSDMNRISILSFGQQLLPGSGVTG